MNEPITMADMTDVIKVYKDEFPDIFRRASECMELNFALVNKLDLTYYGRLSGEEGMTKTGLLIIILGVIFMKGNHTTEE